jgi:hypothetical protein
VIPLGRRQKRVRRLLLHSHRLSGAEPSTAQHQLPLEGKLLRKAFPVHHHLLQSETSIDRLRRPLESRQ